MRVRKHVITETLLNRSLSKNAAIGYAELRCTNASYGRTYAAFFFFFRIAPTQNTASLAFEYDIASWKAVSTPTFHAACNRVS